MPIHSRLLVLLILARLIVPPSMCLCKLEAPASRAIAWVLGAKPIDLPRDDDDDDHDPGCPASYLSLGLGLKPIPVIEPELGSVSVPVSTPSLPAIPLVVPLSIREIPFATDPLYVRHCALTV